PDSSSMAPDDPLHSSEADAGSFEFLGGVQPLEDAKQSPGIGHVKAGTVIAQDEGFSAGEILDTELDPGMGTAPGKFPGISQQVLQRNRQQAGITDNNQAATGQEFHLAVRPDLAKAIDDAMCNDAEIDFFAVEFAARHAGQTEKVINQFGH